MSINHGINIAGKNHTYLVSKYIAKLFKRFRLGIKVGRLIECWEHIMSREGFTNS